MIEEMAVEAALRGDPRLVFQSIAYDPLTAAVLLPQFKHFEA
jgi:alpha-galactosidase/6-phospho-beta-glucosidase family protein